ncbi:MAG: cbb3-type cytochrome c oxidase N-terminal domain-containing protein [Saprospiraceae bacterium]
MAIILLGLPLFAQAKPSQSNFYFEWAMNNILIVLGGMILIGVGFTLWNLMDTMAKHHQIELLKKQGIHIDDTSSVEKESIFSKVYSKAWSLIPMDRESDIDLGHDYDGIRELDNKLPPWWVWLFYLTIINAAVYMYVYQFSDIGTRQSTEYVESVKKGEEKKRRHLASQLNSVDENNVTALQSTGALEAGKSLYISNCIACHGQNGEGGIGPNLTDEYWIHGGGIQNIFKVIKYGVPEKGMVSWKKQLQPTSIQKLSSYILTLEGTNPPNAKPAQGDKYVIEE